ncbi:MAG: arginine deiminase family protein [Rhizobiaceae bacterium]
MFPGKLSFEFTHAIARRPSRSVTGGLRAVDTGAPDLDSFLDHHETYVAALRSTGALVSVLDELEDFPDSVFVEDTALCLPQGAIVMRPGAPSRLGEAAAMAPHLQHFFKDVRFIKEPGFIEGGDILVTGTEILVGRSSRTNAQGIAQLGDLTEDWGIPVREVITPPGVLHFKTDCSLLDAETILSTPRLDASGCFSRYRVIHTAPGEEAAANAIRFNNLVLMADGFPGTAEALEKAGYTVKRIPNTQAAKLDGGMSCLSLRFSLPRS